MMSSDFPPFPVTNSDPDDVQSMVRFLLYTNEFDVEGLIASAGTYGMVARKANILAALDEYDKVDENLRTRDPNFPTADALRAVTYQGLGNGDGISIKWNCTNGSADDLIGEGRDSEASDAIIAAADKLDPRPIWIGVWGGPREIAQAIWRVRHDRTEEQAMAVIRKLRLFLIHCQDATRHYLMDIPELFVIESKTTYVGFGCPGSDNCNLDWLNENVRFNHGPLGAIYEPRAAMGEGVQEGDSPSFMHLISAYRLGHDPEDPTQESWGGQYVGVEGTQHWKDGPGPGTIGKWRADYQAEFEERADWMLP